MLTTAFSLGTALRLPPFLASAFAAADAVALPAAHPGWPRDLPPPANRPDEGTPAEPAAACEAGDEADTQPLPLVALRGSAVGGWYDSSLDLRLGLQVEDLGPVEWRDAWDDTFTA